MKYSFTLLHPHSKASVTERIKEIGLRMAIGATPINILGQFILESVILSTVGGAIGVALGAMGGVIGITLFIIFSVRLYRTIRIDPIMSFCVIPFYAYGLGGFSMRRMSFWIIVSLTASYAIQRRKETGRTEVEPYLTESAGAAIDSPKGT